MKKFEDRGQGGMWIVDDQTQIYLKPEEAYTLWEWLSTHRDVFLGYARGKELEIRLYQEDLGHLSELKAAIPVVQERGPIAKVLNVPWEAVTERAIELLKEYQLEYHIHPLLEDEDTFAQ
ncbi:MAG TPA: hypothetical protein VFA41_20275 [Ktedonobacteraceae bacterium]|jgi:hypothetical protein|nr:hypothetical protein [Ktedonobacteraceae bacterium]